MKFKKHYPKEINDKELIWLISDINRILIRFRISKNKFSLLQSICSYLTCRHILYLNNNSLIKSTYSRFLIYDLWLECKSKINSKNINNLK